MIHKWKFCYYHSKIRNCLKIENRYLKQNVSFKRGGQGFPGGAVVKNLPANAGDTGLSPGPGRSHMPWSN